MKNLIIAFLITMTSQLVLANRTVICENQSSKGVMAEILFETTNCSELMSEIAISYDGG